MKVVYFAALRRQIGVAEELVEPPSEVTDVAGLLFWLRQRSPAHDAALAPSKRLMVAIDLDYAGLESALTGAAEVAFFPPVTGG